MKTWQLTVALPIFCSFCLTWFFTCSSNIHYLFWITGMLSVKDLPYNLANFNCNKIKLQVTFGEFIHSGNNNVRGSHFYLEQSHQNCQVPTEESDFYTLKQSYVKISSSVLARSSGLYRQPKSFSDHFN